MSKARHARPSRGRKAALVVGSAALPGIAGVLLTSAPAHASVMPVHLESDVVTAVPQVGFTHLLKTVAQEYTVAPGDSLSGIAQAHCGSAADWASLYQANQKVIGGNPNLIYAGEQLTLDCSEVPAPVRIEETAPKPDVVTAHVTDAPGTYSCSALQGLWDQAGGNPADSFMAAEIATAESGGRSDAISPTDDFGLWQINGSHGALATLDPLGNAKAAVIISDDGTDWDPWTTYTMGMYEGKC